MINLLAATSWTDPGTGASLGDVNNLFNATPPGGAPNSPTNTVVSFFLGILIFAAIIIALFYLIWGGIDWITSEGNKQKVETARTKIFMSLIGLIIVFLTFFIINILLNFFRITL